MGLVDSVAEAGAAWRSTLIASVAFRCRLRGVPATVRVTILDTLHGPKRAFLERRMDAVGALLELPPALLVRKNLGRSDLGAADLRSKEDPAAPLGTLMDDALADVLLRPLREQFATTSTWTRVLTGAPLLEETLAQRGHMVDGVLCAAPTRTVLRPELLLVLAACARVGEECGGSLAALGNVEEFVWSLRQHVRAAVRAVEASDPQELHARVMWSDMNECMRLPTELALCILRRAPFQLARCLPGSFLIENPARRFEEWMANAFRVCLQDVAPDRCLTVEEQEQQCVHGRVHFSGGAGAGEEKRWAMKPDLLIKRDGRAVAVLDAKFKVAHLGGEAGRDGDGGSWWGQRGDRFQAHTYAAIIGTPRCYVVYLLGKAPRVQLRVGGKELECFSLLVCDDPGREAPLEELSTAALLTAARSRIHEVSEHIVSALPAPE